ncbi:MAG: hypothetical protein K6E51_11375 [Treponema sp.]|nr:hypothetical protein [Treponema sp.]
MRYNILIKFIFTTLFVLVLNACVSTPTETPEKEVVQEPTEEVENIVIPEITEAPQNDLDAEYNRSISALADGSTITIDVFQEDKKQIMAIIEELSQAINKQDFSTWYKHVDKNSITYWRDVKKLKKVSDQLPIKGLTLGSLQDYFRYVFIPSRKGRNVDEIRYISESSVKAVQVDGETDVIYYNFVKNNGTWKVQLPKLEG